MRTGTFCTGAQSRVVADAYHMMFLIWSDVTKESLPNRLWPVIDTVMTVPVTDFVQLMKDLDDILVEEIQRNESPDLRECFKRTLTERPWSMPFLLWLDSLDIDFEFDRINAFTVLHQIFTFIGRLTLPDRDDLEQEALRAYKSKEEELSRLPRIACPEVVKVIRRWFPNTVETYESLYSDWMPKHGPGSVNQGNLDIGDKYLSFRVDDDLVHFLQLCDEGRYPRPIPYGLDRTSKVIFVPKSATKLRTISMEPAILMFHQQAGNRALCRYFRRHRYLRRRIDLQFPEKNAMMACLGSFDGSYATIDLSSASDSVSWDLVRACFYDTPVYPMLKALRSTHYLLPDGSRRPYEKFAPMGSALCFPIECLVFTGIVEAAIKRVGGDPMHSEFCVYGDDIVVEAEYSDAVISELEQFGFSVNRDKSFTEQALFPFRESCGGEYLMGSDVTPLRIPRKFSGYSDLLSNSERYDQLINIANRCYKRFPMARSYIVNTMLNLPVWARPLFVNEGESGGIITSDPTHYRHQKREFVNPSLTPYRFHRTSVKHGCVKPQRFRIDEADEDIRLYECLRCLENRPSDETSEGELFIHRQYQGPSARRLASRWTLI